MTEPRGKTEEQKEEKPVIHEASKEDWEDFFAVQEDLNYLFDR